MIADNPMLTGDHAFRLLNTITFWQKLFSFSKCLFSDSSLMKAARVMSCLDDKFLRRLYVLICPPETSGYGKYGVIINIFIVYLPMHSVNNFKITYFSVFSTTSQCAERLLMPSSSTSIDAKYSVPSLINCSKGLSTTG